MPLKIEIRGRGCRVSRVLGAFVVLANAAAFAQVPVVPPEATPGVLQEQLRRNLPQPPVEMRPVAPASAPQPIYPPGAETAKLNIRSVQVSGNTAIPTDALAPAWADIVGRELPATAAYDLAAQLTGLYRNQGYVFSTVIAPDDLVARGLPDGVLRLQVIEGFVGQVRFQSEAPLSARIQEEAQAIGRERPLTIRTLERQLLIINDIPGVTAQAFFEPAGPPGETVLTLTVARRPVTGFVGIQNRVSRLLGHALIEGRMSLNNPLGLDDSHTFLLQTTDRARLRSVGYAYDQPLGTDGLALNVFLGRIESKTAFPEADLAAQGRSLDERVRSTSNITSIGLSYPLTRSRGQSLRLRARLSTFDGEQDALGQELQDRVRALRLGASWDRSDASGVNFADVEFSKGLSGLGATDGNSPAAIRRDADYGFSKINFFAGRLQQLGGSFSLQASVQGQWTDDRLPPSERAALGGELILRAFNAGELIGDRMWAGKLELRYEPALIPGGRVSFYGFGEIGETTSLEIAPTPRLVSKGGSTGLGVRGTLANGANFYAEVAVPHRRNVAQNNSRRARFFAGVSYQF